MNVQFLLILVVRVFCRLTLIHILWKLAIVIGVDNEYVVFTRRATPRSSTVPLLIGYKLRSLGQARGLEATSRSTRSLCLSFPDRCSQYSGINTSNQGISVTKITITWWSRNLHWWYYLLYQLFMLIVYLVGPTSLHFNEFISTDYKTVTIMFQTTDLNTRLYKGWLKSITYIPPPHVSLFTLAHIFIRLMAI